jgi:hypothetical protein
MVMHVVEVEGVGKVAAYKGRTLLHDEALCVLVAANYPCRCIHARAVAAIGKVRWSLCWELTFFLCDGSAYELMGPDMCHTRRLCALHMCQNLLSSAVIRPGHAAVVEVREVGSAGLSEQAFIAAAHL